MPNDSGMQDLVQAVQTVALALTAEDDSPYHDWVPTFTNFTGTINVAKYKIVGKTCIFYIKVTQGASVTGQHVFSLPAEVSAAQAITSPPNFIAYGSIIDGSTTAEFNARAKLLSSTTVGLVAERVDGTYAYPLPTSGLIPMTWANGQDSFILSGHYEIK